MITNIFKEVVAVPHYPDSVVIQWELKDVCLPGDYKFFVSMSGSPEGPFEPRHILPLINKNTFIDQIALLTKENQVYYQVQFDSPEGDTFLSPPVNLFRNLEKKQWLIVRNLNKKEELRLVKKVGVEVLVLKRKHFGEPCSCIDPASGYLTDDSCDKCFGTKFAGGFFPPINTYAEIPSYSLEKVMDQQGLGMAENWNSQPRFTNYPILTRGDVVVEKDSNRRWHVFQIQPILYRTVTVIQQAILTLAAPSDIIYRMEVPLIL